MSVERFTEERRKKRDAFIAAGVLPYPATIPRTHTLQEAIEQFASLAQSKKKIILVGRVSALRGQGGVLFIDIKDEKGKFQIVVKRNNLSAQGARLPVGQGSASGRKEYDLYKENLDLGDFLGVEGKLFTTARGEKSIEAKKLILVTKSLRPLPSEWYGLENTEKRLREREIDLVMNPELRELFYKKDLFWNTMRSFLKEKGFTEVETPALESIPGGAEAAPFTTHLNALDIDLYLRISPELSLKRLLVGGFENVFEIGRIFRNEGIDAEHLQDYTQLELYWAYHDYEDGMKLVEEMYKLVIKNVLGSLSMKWEGQVIKWSGKWPKVSYSDLFTKYFGMNLDTASLEDLRARAKELKIQFEPSASRGRLIDLLFKKKIRPELIQPCFLIDPPVDIEPLAKRIANAPDRVHRFQVVACGSELGKGFSELNDPDDQRARFEEQEKAREAGDKEAQFMNDPFVRALEYGMPPATGFGVSERLFAILMGKPIRETVFFPLMRPEKK